MRKTTASTLKKEIEKDLETRVRPPPLNREPTQIPWLHKLNHQNRSFSLSSQVVPSTLQFYSMKQEAYVSGSALFWLSQCMRFANDKQGLVFLMLPKFSITLTSLGIMLCVENQNNPAMVLNSIQLRSPVNLNFIRNNDMFKIRS